MSIIFNQLSLKIQNLKVVEALIEKLNLKKKSKNNTSAKIFQKDLELNYFRKSLKNERINLLFLVHA